MTYKFDNEAYRKTLELVKEIKDHNEQHRQFDQDIPDSVGLNIKSILIAGMIMGLALFVLVGTVVLIPVILVVAVGYTVFLWCKASIK